MIDFQHTLLIGNHIQLEPINESHKEELYHVTQDDSIWTFTSSKAMGHQFDSWFQKALQELEKLEHLPFIVRRLSDNKLIGSTRFYDIQQAHRRLTIGYTWYIPEVWGTYVNPECKLLLLQYAFEELNINRVQFDTDFRNVRSRAAIKKLGAIQEGILRHHMILEDGFIRDTVVFSIIKTDWADVKQKLQSRIQSTNSS